MNRLTVALPKGRLLRSAMELFQTVGADFGSFTERSRKLIVDDTTGQYRFMMAKPFDIPTYVEYGTADLGIVGSDVLMEEARDVIEPLDLRFGECRLVLAVPSFRASEELARHKIHRIATKYPRITSRYFEALGLQVETIKLYGSVELAPLSGLAEMIVDLVETGRTMKDNGLVPIAEVASSSARFIVNRASHKLYFDRINTLIERLTEAVPC